MTTRGEQPLLLLPYRGMILTPLLGWFIDNKGKAASMLMLGSLLMIVCHLIFALTPTESFTFAIALTAIIVLGVSFSWFRHLFGLQFPSW